MTDLNQEDIKAAEKLTEAYKTICTEMSRAIVGQEEVLEQLLMCIFARGHAILEGVPGLAKTLMVSSLAECLDLGFARIQFTPDLMPSDITGTEVIQENRATGAREFKFLQGPIFSNVILADEINRTPPKTQAALLEAMQERQVTVGGNRMPMMDPFFVLATQNPIEQEGTYPLPEAQMDRFMFLINVGYPTEAEERRILAMTTAGYAPDVQPVLHREEIIDLQQFVRRVNIPEDVVSFILRLVRATRSSEPEAPDFIRKWVTWGASPRACQNLVLGAKSAAILDGRHEANQEDVMGVAHPVLGHRILPNFAAEAEHVTTQEIVDDLLEHIA